MKIEVRTYFPQSPIGDNNAKPQALGNLLAEARKRKVAITGDVEHIFIGPTPKKPQWMIFSHAEVED